MRRVARIGGAVLGGVLVMIIALASPVIYVETMCRPTASPAPRDQPSATLPGEARPAVRTLLTYPEWHIVHAYDDYAEVIRQDDPHAFDFLAAIGGYWRSLCMLTRASGDLGRIDSATRQMVHVIGVSFTVEMLMKAAYEESLGRAVAWLRGPERSRLDKMSAEQAARYATFLQQVPWYLHDFRADADALRSASEGSLRDRERALALGIEHRARAGYASLIEQAVAATGQDDPTLQMVVTNLSLQHAEATGGVRVLRHIGAGIEVETPRYRALTRILADWAAAGANFVDVAGNDRIMFTATSKQLMVANSLASLPRQGYRDARHLFLVPVAELADRLRGLDAAGLRLEHIHDY